MTIEEQRKAVIEAAVLLAKYCHETPCEDCIFEQRKCCRLDDNYPEMWDLVGLQKEVGE